MSLISLITEMGSTKEVNYLFSEEMLRQKKKINSPSLHMLSLRSLYGRSCKDERACSNLGEDFRLERPEKKAKIKRVKSCKEERVSIESAQECHLMLSGWEQRSYQESWLFLCRSVTCLECYFSFIWVK